MTASTNTNDLNDVQPPPRMAVFRFGENQSAGECDGSTRAWTIRRMQLTRNKGEWKMEMTKFEKLLDNIDAERIAHNDYFKANESNLDLKRLYAFEQRIHDMFDAAGEIIRAVGYDTPEGKKLSAIAAERAKLRPQRLLRDPKVIREEARQHVAETKRRHKERLDNHYLKGMSASERKEWAEGQRRFQEKIDSQGGNCTECGEPLDVNEQLVAWGRNNTLICETCTVESMEYHGDPIL